MTASLAVPRGDETPLRREPRVNAMITAPAQQPCLKIAVFIHQRDRPSDYAGTSELVRQGVTKSGRAIESRLL